MNKEAYNAYHRNYYNTVVNKEARKLQLREYYNKNRVELNRKKKEKRDKAKKMLI